MERSQAAWLALATVVLGGCASAPGGMYGQPYALFEPERRMPAADTRSAFIMKIDGRDRDIGRNDPVPPGLHEVEVSIPGPPGMSDPGRDTLQVDAKPCTRYYFSAMRSSPTARDWRAFISATETIGECASKFGLK
jgi:hypothetical protein